MVREATDAAERKDGQGTGKETGDVGSGSDRVRRDGMIGYNWWQQKACKKLVTQTRASRQPNAGEQGKDQGKGFGNEKWVWSEVGGSGGK